METNQSVIGQILDEDPYLAYQPAFAYTLPIQLFVNGITVTLLVILCIHLAFTLQYHYPLAPLNYSLQLSSVVVVLISVIIKIVVILEDSADHADNWPYDLNYVAVSIPPKSWSTAQDAAWLFLQALNNGLANITHIQFLTLLYPSRVEARLIIFVLGPLAIAASALVFTALSGSQTVLDVSDSIRNVLNSTLLLIFTIALALWGLFVNRRRAWRTDGGTAVFGFGALLLAVVSTTFNFVAVAEDGIDWLQHLLFAAVLWQTWLGWWWWVGSGMGIGEVEDLMEKNERKKRKLAKRAARQRVNAANARNRNNNASQDGGSASASASVMAGLNSMAGILRNRSSTLTRRHTSRSHMTNYNNNDEEEGIEMDRLHTSSRPPTRNGIRAVEFSGDANGEPAAAEGSMSRGAIQSTNSEASSTSATPSLHPPKSVASLLAFPTTWLQVYFRRLRHAHQDAARQQALQRAERRQQVFAGEGAGNVGVGGVMAGSRRESDAMRSARAEAGVVEGEELGWGLGRFGIKEHEQSATRLRAARDRIQGDRLLGASQAEEGIAGGEEGESLGGERQVEAGPSRLPIGRGEGGGEGEWVDVEDLSSSSSGKTRTKAAERKRKKELKRKQKETLGGVGDRQSEGGTGWSWWGPLREWRLNDRSTF